MIRSFSRSRPKLAVPPTCKRYRASVDINHWVLLMSVWKHSVFDKTSICTFALIFADVDRSVRIGRQRRRQATEGAADGHARAQRKVDDPRAEQVCARNAAVVIGAVS